MTVVNRAVRAASLEEKRELDSMTGANRAVRAASPREGKRDIDWSEGQATTGRGYQQIHRLVGKRGRISSDLKI